jgi:hypothetical protein
MATEISAQIQFQILGIFAANTEPLVMLLKVNDQSEEEPNPSQEQKYAP